jgi:hypothetical protein
MAIHASALPQLIPRRQNINCKPSACLANSSDRIICRRVKGRQSLSDQLAQNTDFSWRNGPPVWRLTDPDAKAQGIKGIMPLQSVPVTVAWVHEHWVYGWGVREDDSRFNWRSQGVDEPQRQITQAHKDKFILGAQLKTAICLISIIPYWLYYKFFYTDCLFKVIFLT